MLAHIFIEKVPLRNLLPFYMSANSISIYKLKNFNQKNKHIKIFSKTYYGFSDETAYRKQIGNSFLTQLV